MITVENYVTGNAGGPTGQTGHAPDRETAGRTEALLADDQAAAPEHAPEVAASGSALHHARLELLTLNDQLEQANGALARANEPCARLRLLADDLTRAEQKVVSQRSRYDETVGRWIASGCKGDRPECPPSLIASERELAEKAVDARAAKSALPDHEAVAALAAQHVRDLGVRRSKAHILAAVDAAREYCAAHFRLAFSHYRASENRLRNLEDALALGGHHGGADQIRQMIAVVKSAPDPQADIPAGQNFLRALLADPSAELVP